MSANMLQVRVVCLLTCDRTPSSSIVRTHFSLTWTLSSTCRHLTTCITVDKKPEKVLTAENFIEQETKARKLLTKDSKYIKLMRFNWYFLCLMLPFVHLLQSLPLCCHVQFQSVEGSNHFTHGEFDRLLLELHGVAVSLLEAWWLIVLRSDWKTGKPRQTTHCSLLMCWRCKYECFCVHFVSSLCFHTVFVSLKLIHKPALTNCPWARYLTFSYILESD